MLVGILRGENPEGGDKWQLACNKKGIEADVIDLTSADALSLVMNKPYGLFLLRPPGSIERFKNLYDERLYHITRALKTPMFPTFFENYIYENKKSLSAFLTLEGIPHPKTDVFYRYEEVKEFLDVAKYPIVAKTSIGAASSGVKILRNKEEAHRYCKQAFVGKGIKRRFGPNKYVGTPQSWFTKTINDPQFFKRKLLGYFKAYGEVQKGYVILQEYVEHEFEWRVAKIGDSYFAYKKFKVGDIASGTKNLGFGEPPHDLLDFVRDISEKYGILTAAFDIFESGGRYLINEIQTIFGHKFDHILEVDGEPGRYIYDSGKWVFEEGMFNSNESYDLRLEAALIQYNKTVGK
ncbi:MAG: hypothetical protein WC990_02170 [Sphaerochaetaceae bacterium]